MMWIYAAPLFLQGLCIFVDEFYFHHKRGLPKWEIWGHPLDTLTVALPLGLAAFFTYSRELLYVFIGLSAFSSLFVTKDEFVHAKLCDPKEQWLHAMLFILHPTAFFAAGALWVNGVGSTLIMTQFILISLFMLYQILYWGGPWLWVQKKFR